MIENSSMIHQLPEMHHVGYVVRDLNKTIEEFRQRYAIAETPAIYDFKPMRTWTDGKEVDGCHLRICKLQIQDSLAAEIIEHVSGDVEHKRFIEATGGGLHHVAYRVDRYDAYRQYMVDLGGFPVFEQEAEDDLQGYRRSIYFLFRESQSVVEILEAAYFRKKP